jgi:integrase
MSVLKGYWIAQNDGQIYVVSKADNSPYNPSYISRLFNEFLRANSLPSIRFHDLRHAYATHSHYNGMPIKELSVSLGHKSAATTLDHYVHR